MDINNTNLENALSSTEAQAPAETAPQMTTEMEIGFHQGALNTLAGEKHALIEMIRNVEERMITHSTALQNLGMVAQKKE